MKKIFGSVILLSIFIGLFTVMAMNRGFLVAAAVWATAFVLTAIIALGVWLIVDD